MAAPSPAPSSAPSSSSLAPDGWRAGLPAELQSQLRALPPDALADILNADSWKDCLTDTDRHSLRALLPADGGEGEDQGVECLDDVLHNRHVRFGTPLTHFHRLLAAERLNEAASAECQRLAAAHFARVRARHNGMVAELHRLKRSGFLPPQPRVPLKKFAGGGDSADLGDMLTYSKAAGGLMRKGRSMPGRRLEPGEVAIPTPGEGGEGDADGGAKRAKTEVA